MGPALLPRLAEQCDIFARRSQPEEYGGPPFQAGWDKYSGRACNPRAPDDQWGSSAALAGDFGHASGAAPAASHPLCDREYDFDTLEQGLHHCAGLHAHQNGYHGYCGASGGVDAL